MTEVNQASQLGRRNLLKTLGVGATVGAAAAAIGVGEAQAKPENATERKKQRYRESAHVKKFYELNRR
jgi:hypothetical protein